MTVLKRDDLVWMEVCFIVFCLGRPDGPRQGDVGQHRFVYTDYITRVYITDSDSFGSELTA